MQKLHLVGFTTDQKGLILSARRGARSGSFQLAVDQALAEAVEELWAQQLEAERTETSAARSARIESALSVREIQARLRQGRSVADLARVAGVDPEWIERFAPPVFAERAQVITSVQSTPLQRVRLGPSEQPIGEAIRRNLADRNVSLSPEEFSAAWSARQLADRRWAVGFHYQYRNRDQALRFDLDPASGAIVAADRTSESLAYITPASPREEHSDGPGLGDAVDTATSPAAKERERATEAMRKAAVKAAAATERAAARRAKEQEAERARREREALAEEARKERERAAAERARAAAARKKAAAAKKRAAERAKAKADKQAADQARRAEAALLAAERRAAAARQAASAKPKPAKAPAPHAKPPAAATKAPGPPREAPPDAHPDSGNGSERPPGDLPARPLRAT